MKMRLPAGDLCALLVAQVVGEQAALGLHHEVQSLRSTFLHQYGPVRVIGSQRRGHLEPAWQLGVELNGVVLLQRVGEVALGGGVVDHVLVDGLARVHQHVLQVAGQLFLLEQFLCIDVLIAKLLVLDAVDQGQALAAVDGLGGQLDELLRVALEVVQPPAAAQDGGDAPAGELGAILEVGEQVRQLDVRLVQDDSCRARFLRGLHPCLADGDVGLAPLQPGLGDGRGLSKRIDAVLDQLVIIELHPIGRLVLDAIPQLLELGAEIDALAHGNLLALVGVLDFQTARHLAQHLGDLTALRVELRR